MSLERMVVKVGGSLLDWPELPARLTHWLSTQAHWRVLVVPGGGPAADLIRAYDRKFQLGEEAAHWLALRMLQVNAHLLAQLLPGATLVTTSPGTTPLGIVDAYAFARDDDLRPDHLPHTWDVTSDSVAARVACLVEARELVLLKSIDWNSSDWHHAAREGIVDPCFPRVLRQNPDLRARVINLRAWQAPTA